MEIRSPRAPKPDEMRSTSKSVNTSEFFPCMPTTSERRVMAESSDPFLPPLREDDDAVISLVKIFPQLRKKSRRRVWVTGDGERSSFACSSSGHLCKTRKSNTTEPVAKNVDFACVDILYFPMNQDEVDTVLKKVRHKTKEPKRLSVGIEVYEFLRCRGTAMALRDACDLADECEQPHSPCWSVVWDSRDGASFYVPEVTGRRFSDLKSFESVPLRIPRFRAIELIDEWWVCFEHFGNVPGPSERLEHLCFLGLSFFVVVFACCGVCAP